MRKSVIFVCLMVIVISVLSSGIRASFTKGNLSMSIDMSYSPGEKIRGWINISLNQEPSDSFLTSSSGGGINLINFLDESSADYDCIPGNYGVCYEDYTLSNGNSIKTFNLPGGSDKTVSFQVSGKIASIDNVSFSVNFGSQPMCTNQVEVDMLDDNLIDWQPWNFTEDFLCTYSGGKGCFDMSVSSIEANISDKSFCEEVTLIKSGKFKIGAWIKKVSDDVGLLTMEVYGLGGGSPLASCALPAGSSSGGEVECSVDFDNSLTQKYYVCIKSDRIDSGYATKMESVSPCGFLFATTLPPPPTQAKADFYIFAKAYGFSKLRSFVFNQAEYVRLGNSGELTSEIMEYLRERYEPNCEGNCNVDCSNGCAIPIRFKANSNINVTVSEAVITYTTEVLPHLSNSNIYDAFTSKPKISSGFLQLDLEYANITAPSTYGNSTLVISLGGQEIGSKQITMSRIPIIGGILPTIVPAAVLTTLTADVYSPNNSTIVSYRWDFGDNSEEETFVNFVKHAYPSVGLYTLTLEVEDEDGLIASKEFDVIAGNPKQVVNTTLKSYRTRVNSITTQINTEANWIKKILEDEIGIDDINSKLTSLERKFSLAESDDDYSSIMANLSEMSIPSLLKKGSLMNFPILLDTEIIDFDYLAEYDEDYLLNSDEEDEDYLDSSDAREAYKNAIAKWYSDNVDASADFYIISAYYDSGVEVILTYYKLKITALDPQDDEAYLIINNDANVNPAETIKEFGGSVGVKFYKLEDRELEFVLIDENDPFNLEVYIAPGFRKLDAKLLVGVCNFNKRCESDKGENSKNCRADCKPWGWALFYIILVLFLAFIGYIGLQEWYKRKYENHLFKNRNDLYNILHFMNNSLARGMSREEISKNLKKAGWNSEQISYAMKKIKGKKVGMPLEIGIPKFGRKNKKLTPEPKKNIGKL
ncbi:MAG: PKD domain-containing protein [Nanoarchaeota archaeon]